MSPGYDPKVARSAPDEEAVECTARTWSLAPEIRAPGSIGPMAMFKGVASGGDETRTLFIGMEVPSWEGALPRGAARLVWTDGTKLDPPPGDFWFAYPRALYDTQGLLHLVWGEPEADGSAHSHWASLRIGRVMHSIRDPLGDWSKPAIVVSGGNLRWSPGEGAIGRGVPNGISVVVAPTLKSLTIARWSEGEWSRVTIPALVPLYSALVSHSADTALLAYVGIGRTDDAIPRSVGNSLLLHRSLDSGASWGPASVLQLSTHGRALDLATLSLRDGSIVLLWGQAAPGGAFGATVRLVQSTDGGASWSEPSVVESRYGSPFSAVVDDAGRVHLVWAAEPTGPSEERRLMYACWDGGWSSPHTILDDTVGRGDSPTMRVNRDGSLELVWNRTTDPTRSLVTSSMQRAVGRPVPRDRAQAQR